MQEKVWRGDQGGDLGTEGGRGSYKVRLMGMVEGLRRAETSATGCTIQAATTRGIGALGSDKMKLQKTHNFKTWWLGWQSEWT